MHKQKNAFVFNVRTWFALLGLAIAVYIVISYVNVLFNTFGLLFITALLSLLINPLADALQQRGVPRMWTVILVYIAAILIVALIVALIVPLVLDNLGALATNSEQIVVSIVTNIDEFPGIGRLLNLSNQLEDGPPPAVTEVLRGLALTIPGTLANTGNLLFSGFIIAVLVFFLVVDQNISRALLKTWVPEHYHERIIQLTERASVGLSRWFVAQLCISGYWVVAYTLMLYLLGIPYAFTIGIISGILEFIPYLGGIIGSILMILSALTVDPWLALWSVIWGIPIGIIGINIVVPFFFSRAINVHPAAILLALFIGGQIGGVFTALLTVPVVVLITVLDREFRLQQVVRRRTVATLQNTATETKEAT